MSKRIIATITKIGDTGREYVSQRGNHGIAFPVKISTELGEAVFEAYVSSKEVLAERGLVVGAIGTIEVSCSYRQYTDKNGAIRFSNDFRVDGYSWQLANQNIQRAEQAPAQEPEPAPVVVPQEKTPEMKAAAEAMMAKAAEEMANGEDQGLPF